MRLRIRSISLTVCALGLLTAVGTAQTSSRPAARSASDPVRATVLYQDRVIELTRAQRDANDLWITPADLTRINDFVLKP